MEATPRPFQHVCCPASTFPLWGPVSPPPLGGLSLNPLPYRPRSLFSLGPHDLLLPSAKKTSVAAPCLSLEENIRKVKRNSKISFIYILLNLVCPKQHHFKVCREPHFHAQQTLGPGRYPMRWHPSRGRAGQVEKQVKLSPGPLAVVTVNLCLFQALSC